MSQAPAPAGAPAKPFVFPKAAQADVALLLEGTYPYVSGGVSSWVHQIIRGCPDLKFAAYFLGSQPSDYGAIRFELPPNLVHLEVNYLFKSGDKVQPKAIKGDAKVFDGVRCMHARWREQGAAALAGKEVDKSNPDLATVLGQLGKSLNEEQFLHSEQAWKFITENFNAHCTDPSFVDYFWTVRIMHTPIFTLQRVVDHMIPVKAFHTISTGYAGLLGAMCARRFGKPLVLSEHGIYTKERKIDLMAAQWIADRRGPLSQDATQISYFRELWIRFFQGIGRACYDAADPIIALYEANRLRQVADGAIDSRTTCVANGISLPTFGPLRHQRPEKVPQVVCMIGRVVPIKDVKTFVRAMRGLVNRLPEAEGWIAGPEDEDPGYAAECKALVAGLGLQDRVKFLGFQRLTELLPKVGLVVLSSISEALPLVLLEGYAAGVPAVSTDVGSCRQLIEGLPGEDAALGSSGRVVGIADPQALADAMIELLSDEAAWKLASENGIKRVEKYYTQDMMLGRYHDIYKQVGAWPA